MKTIGIVGTRSRDSFEDYELVCNKFKKVYNTIDDNETIRICSGLCPKGGDKFAVRIANDLSLLTLWFPAEWDKYGKSAGFIRNTDIARESDILIACVASDRKGGTEDTIKKFIKFHREENLYIV